MPSTHTIKILFYCDDADQSWVSINGAKPSQPDTHDDSAYRSGEHEFGVGILKTLLENHQGGDGFKTIKYEIDVVNRNYEYDSKGYVVSRLDEANLNFITPELLVEYSQIWIFGFHYGNNLVPAGNHKVVRDRTRISPGEDWHRLWSSRSKQEFTDSELRALAEWMDAGNGVLITGDHSNSVDGVNGNRLNLNLGRSLGKHIKRAGELRVWEDGPLAFYPHNVDTTRGLPQKDMYKMVEQEDDIPQKVITTREIDLLGQTPPVPHMLFQDLTTVDNPSGTVRYLPDHQHEGAIKIPSDYGRVDEKGKPIWPSKNGVQPKPEIVAWGVNYAATKPPLASPFSRSVGLVVAYDGHPVGVGNIVAHSTWHHFVNVNLVGFLNGTQPNETLKQIRAYFANLACYLENPNKIDIFVIFAANLPPMKSPISDGPDFGGLNSGKNPLTNHSILAKEVGTFAFQHLSRIINPVHLRYYLQDQMNIASVEHGATFNMAENFDSLSVLGEILLASNEAPPSSTESDSLASSAAIPQKGIFRALENHLARQEETLKPIRQAKESMQRKFGREFNS
jgi:hypothetical protein